MKSLKHFFLMFLLACFSTSAFAEKPDADKAFKQLTALIGTWKGSSPGGREHTVNYRLTAGDTVLVETWSLSSGRESMTMYHLDGNVLRATHYCPQGNQPRLVLVSNEDAMHFEFRDGTNLQVPDKSHQHSFWLKIIDNAHFQRNEIYVENGATRSEVPVEDPQETFSYTRMP